MLSHRGVHNFSPGVLDSYFRFNELVDKGKIRELKNNAGYYIDRGANKMTMIYSSTVDLAEAAECQKMGPVYSIDELKLDGAAAFIEVAYDINVVFNKASYATAKKRHQRTVYPFKWIEKQGITLEELSTENRDEVIALHDIWVEQKLADPKTFKIMFPNARYSRCVDLCLAPARVVKNQVGFGMIKDFSIHPKYVGIVAKRDGNVVASRVVSVDSSYGFDLAFFGNTWSEPSQLMNHLDIVTLAFLRDNYSIRLFNFGAAMSTSLKNFKAHIPSYTIKSWRYKKT